MQLSTNSPISNFLIDDNNEFGKSYKAIYKRFIDLQNKGINDLLDVKIDGGAFDCNCKQKIRIQNIKEDEIFILNLPKKFSFINILFNNSYRKIIDNNDYKSYNQYNVNLDFIEDNLTEFLLKNKKLLDEKDNITNFVYKNEEFNLDNIDIVTTFNKKFEARDLTIDDKVILYKFCMDNQENIILVKNLIEDFNSFIIFINNTRKDDAINKEITEDTKIQNILNYLKEGAISEQFKEFIKDRDTFTVDKLANIFEYFLVSIFITIKNDINNYQIELQEEQISEIKSYFDQEKKRIIKKNILSKALRLLITLVLAKDEDKENKIKQNKNNIVKINQVLTLYDLLGGDIGEDAFNDVKEQIEKNEEVNRPPENIEKKDEEENEEIDEVEGEDEKEKIEEAEEDDDDYYGGGEATTSRRRGDDDE